MPRSRRVSRTVAVAVLTVVGMLALTAPGHAAGPGGPATAGSTVAPDTRTGSLVDRGRLDAAVAHVVDDVAAVVERARTAVGETLAWQRDAVVAWWTGSAPGWVRQAARVGPALWDLRDSARELMRSQAHRWLSWVAGDGAVARR
ncbi:hypothetical protein OMK64_08100 [Cellulomonas fimi]|uniref:hypothetical protein n=1 Tax=Cellulomonas fimi TaxID=1708 RepID=UPI00234D050E|nr:hypothetical protein [Cellulomonas fimi]MDC7121497.1 hypothetical protein [Cellulomonas fimi]